MKRAIKASIDRLGLGNGARKLHTESLLVGERVSFALRGRPEASEAIVIFAHGRTGSSWLQEVLSDRTAMQPIHEPLSPRHMRRVGSLVGRADPPGYISSPYLRPNADAPEWRTLLEDILRGRVRNSWTNPTIHHMFPRGFIVKVIRGNLLAGFVAQNFAPRIVVLERHPCAVLASRLSAGWRADVADILTQPQLIEDHLADHAEELSRHTGDPVASLAIWYAVETSICRRQLATTQHVRVRYEDLARKPLEMFNKLLSDVVGSETAIDASAQFTAASRMGRCHYSTDAEDVDARLSAWQSKLTPEQIALSTTWCERLGVGDLCEGI